MNPFRQFETEEKKYDARIADINDEITLAEIELAEDIQERQSVLMDVKGTGNVTNIDKRIETARKRVAALHERAKYVEDAKIQQLVSLLTDVEAERQRAVERKELEYKNAILDHNRRKLEFLQSAKRIGDLANDINDINAAANVCCKAAGVEPQRHWGFQNQMNLNVNPATNGFEYASWNTLAAPEWLVKEALLYKRLPAWKAELKEVSNDGN